MRCESLTSPGNGATTVDGGEVGKGLPTSNEPNL